MTHVLEYLNPAHLLFPALLSSAILGAVFPLLGTQLILRRAVFLGLTLPQIAAAGVACAFWLQQSGLLPYLASHHHGIGFAGSLLFTLVGMGVSAYLEQRGKGSTETRLAAAYALAGALTILFIVFNPAGEVEILSMLKGEVIALSQTEVRTLAGVFAAVLVCMILFRREFLLTSFDRDLAFLLRGSNMLWTLLLYLLAGISIAVGVIMAGPLLIFGFMVLPPLAARPQVKGMTAFLWSASLLGLMMAVVGFFVSVTLDLPLGPTDVAVGCAMVFASHGLNQIRLRARAVLGVIGILVLVLSSACGQRRAAPLDAVAELKNRPVWLSGVTHSTGTELRMPSGNPLRSLAEMAGKLSPDAREPVADRLRAAIQLRLKKQGIEVFLPESKDPRLKNFSMDAAAAAATARQAGMSGLLLRANIRRWNAAPRQITTVVVDFKLVRIADSAAIWERRIRRTVSAAGAAHEGQAHDDAIKQVVQELFEP